MSNILEGLNKEQVEAVTTTEGYVRVIAGAGSGKTNALTKRYAYLVKELDISPERILSVTFTNKAANEMKERVISLVGDIGTPYIMTFHGFCNRFLHSEIEAMGFSPNYKIMDVDDQLDILKVVYNELGLTNKDYPYKKALTEVIGAGCKNGRRQFLNNYEELLENYSSFELHKLMQLSDDIQMKMIYGYLREQKRDGCLDYEDLLNLTLYLLKTRRDIQESWEQVFDYIQVDEFQDVSLREVELISILSMKNGNLFVVGDDSQCLIEGTLVNTPSGYKKIENVKQGDEITVAIGRGEVKNVLVDEVSTKKVNEEIVEVKTEGGKTICGTLNHIGFARFEHNFVSQLVNDAYKLDISLFDCDNKSSDGFYPHEISTNKNERKTSVDYDEIFRYVDEIEKESDKKGIYVDKSIKIKLTENKFNFVPFSQLLPQMIIAVYEDGKIVEDKIISVERKQYSGNVYDLNVSKVRNFIANDIVVHNCIYSFRGSDVRCILQFGEIMDKVQGRHNEVKTIFMTQNYRSTPQILNVSNALIKANKAQVPKDLFTMKNSGIKVLHYHGRNVYTEAEWVANRILSLHRPFSDFAILYRSHFSSRAIEEKLIENKIPYEVLSGISFYSRKEVKDVLAVLGLVAFGDNLSFNRIVKTLSLGIGAKKIAVLQELAGQNDTLYSALKKNTEIKTFKGTKASWLVTFIENLKVYAEKESIAMLMGRVYSELNLEEMFVKSGEQERWENLQELKKSAQLYERLQREKVDLGEYLSMLSLYTNEEREDKVDTVKLMTVHGAKGLEFPVVFVIGMNEGIMPNSKISGPMEMEEERRIAYVAMTRAKEYLFLSDAEGENFDGSYRIPSRFLLNIPRDLYDSEGKIDEYLLKQSRDKIAQENAMSGDNDYSLLNSIVDTHKIELHDKVRHDVFGEGEIMGITDEAYVILFDNYGIKGIKKDSKKIIKVG